MSRTRTSPSPDFGLHADSLRARQALLRERSDLLREALAFECQDAWRGVQQPVDTVGRWEDRFEPLIALLSPWLARLRGVRRLARSQPWAVPLLIWAWRRIRRPGVAASRSVEPAATPGPVNPAGWATSVRHARRVLAWTSLGWKAWRAMR